MNKMSRKIILGVVLILTSFLLIGCTSSELKEDEKTVTITFEEAIEKIKKTDAITIFSISNTESDDVVMSPLKTIRGDEVQKLINILSSSIETQNGYLPSAQYQMVFFDENEDELGSFAFSGASNLTVDGKTFILIEYDADEFNSVLKKSGIEV